MAVPSDISNLVGWWDAGDLTTLFQDSTGTTPAGHGDPVGYIGDKSGGGKHLTQATAGNRPTLLTNIFGGVLKFTGDHWLFNNSWLQAQPYTMLVRWYWPSDLAKTGAAHSYASGVVMGAVSGPFGSFYSLNNNGAADDAMSARFNAGLAAGTGVKTVLPHIANIYVEGESSTFRLSKATGISLNFGTSTKTGMALGAYDSGLLAGQCLIGEVAVWSRALTTGERDQMEEYFYDTRLFTNRTLLVYDGDSITRGAKSTIWGDYPYQLSQLINADHTFVNRAVSGQTVAMGISTDSDVDAYLATAAASKTVFVHFGANDLHNSVPLATLKSRLQTYISDRRTAGADKVIIGTVLPHNETGIFSEANLNDINDWIKAGSSGADAVADFTTHAMGQWGGNLDDTYYDVDEIHPNDTGYAVMAGIWKSAYLSTITTALTPSENQGGLSLGLSMSLFG